MKLDETTKKKIIGLIKALLPDAKIYLYGSRARQDHKPDSDIDLALDIGKVLPRVKTGEVRNVLEATIIPFNFDVVDLNGVSEDMKRDILKEGVVWRIV